MDRRAVPPVAKDVSPVDENESPAGSADPIAVPGENPTHAVNDVVLVPADCPVPLRCPQRFAAILVTEVDIADGPDLDRDGDVLQLGGRWMTTVPGPDEGNDGDVILLLHEPAATPVRDEASRHLDVEMRLLNGERWQRVGIWPNVDDRWPHLIAPTASAIMGLHTDIQELEEPPQRVR